MTYRLLLSSLLTQLRKKYIYALETKTHDPTTPKRKFTKAVSTDFRNAEHCVTAYKESDALQSSGWGEDVDEVYTSPKENTKRIKRQHGLGEFMNHAKKCLCRIAYVFQNSVQNTYYSSTDVI